MKVKRLLSSVTVTGPDVAVNLTGGGKAQVFINLTMGSTDFSFQGQGMRPPQASFAPGTYDCSAVIFAFNHQAVGNDYAAAIEVAGQRVATTAGILDSSARDGSTVGFTLVVQ